METIKLTIDNKEIDVPQGTTIYKAARELGVEPKMEMLPMQPGDVPATYADISKAQKKLGLAEQTIKNNLTTFRKAINESKAYDVNANRKAKGSQAGKGKTTATAGVKFKGDANLDDIVKGLRSMFNKFKENDKTTSLASYLIDALDDFEGESK